ncbi:sulfotransferase domain-containing protein [Shimia thalassica]|uniref:sulfotransferase domain-containing protein n=1 Tax=Shimia thalassica TaxID=1715693 RepID=UPI0026E24220|nr:sulfotransferase domain-containing protein [Shimia thalassica]MDO6478366.1 sulfotransferase domain-containing protein [Shimia thalassica]
MTSTEAAAEDVQTKFEDIQISFPKGEMSFQVANDEDQKVYFCLGVRKSGSTMFSRILTFLARRNQINVVDLPGTAFRSGFTVADWEKADLSEIMKPGNLFSGFRALPQGIANSENFKSASKVFMFRDPRDALISQYYSDAFSHKLPEEGTPGRELFLKKRAEARSTGIDDYVLKHARNMSSTMLGCSDLLTDPTCACFRYEDYVFQKRRMIHKIIKHFDWQCHPGQIENILREIDVVPEAEDTKKFIRKAVPGDHVNKLEPQTIRRLNKHLEECMTVFDYY